MSDRPVPERLPLTSADPLAPRFEELKARLPMVITDGRIDLEKLRALLGEQAASGPERYGLSWAGKSDALKVLRLLTTATLQPAPSESVKWETTGNAIIEGDNLEVLKTLQHAYHGKVKLIYIDPPYNTGGDFIYPDDYAEGLASYQRFTRQVNDEGHKLTTNVNTSGRYHSRWLTMMYPRLYLARNLLREDGVIFVSIDDHEVHNLRLLMDEIFGEENFLSVFVRRRRLATGMRDNPLSPDHEYIVCFARHAPSVRLYGRARKAADYPHKDEKGAYRSTDLTVGMTRDMRPNQFFAIRSPHTGAEYWPPEDRVWRFEPSSMQRQIEEQNIIWPDADPNSKMSRPRFKTRFSENEDAWSPISTWVASSSAELEDDGDTVSGRAGLNQEATKQLRDLFGEQVLEYPKPVSLIRFLAMISTRADDLILDFFAGSGTTAQAVLELNLEDGGNRKFILVQLPEPTGRTDFPTIAEITKERVRRVIRRIEQERAGQLELSAGAPGVDLGFKVFKLAASNFSVWDPALAPAQPDQLATQWQLTADNVRADAQEQALLYELMLKCGLSLSSAVETVDAAGCAVHRLDEGRLVICLAREVTPEALRAMIALQPQSVLCLDIGFKGNDALKVNAQLECQSHGIQFRTA
jgi:adenine-specific DNA-methyltransferase